MLDNNPFSGALSAWKEASGAALQWQLDRIADLGNFLGILDKPVSAPIQEPYELPFDGGQCPVLYDINYRITAQSGQVFGQGVSQQLGPIGGFFWADRRASGEGFGVYLRTGTGDVLFVLTAQADTINEIFSLNRVDGQVDDCGNLPNPNPPFPPDDGAITSTNPDDGKAGELVYAGLPVVTVTGILAALRAIAAALSVINDILDGVRKLGDALKKITDLLDEIFKKKKDDDKDKPKNRKYSVGSWYSLNSIDGFIPVTPITLGGVEAIPYKVQVLVNSFPSTASRVLGTSAPSISIDTLPLFYLLLQEDDFGVTAVKPIRTLNSSTSIPPFHRGVFWNFRLNPSIQAKYRLFYQTEPVEEEKEPTP